LEISAGEVKCGRGAAWAGRGRKRKRKKQAAADRTGIRGRVYVPPVFMRMPPFLEC
jgi:hypothetical protein